MKNFLEIEQYLHYIMNDPAAINNIEKGKQIVCSLAEVGINGTTYQLQLILEPREEYFVPEEAMVTIRRTDKEST